MSFKLSELLAIYKPEQLNAFLREYMNTDLEENNLLYENISDNWTCVEIQNTICQLLTCLKILGKDL